MSTVCEMLLAMLGEMKKNGTIIMGKCKNVYSLGPWTKSNRKSLCFLPDMEREREEVKSLELLAQNQTKNEGVIGNWKTSLTNN